LTGSAHCTSTHRLQLCKVDREEDGGDSQDKNGKANPADTSEDESTPVQLCIGFVLQAVSSCLCSFSCANHTRGPTYQEEDHIRQEKFCLLYSYITTSPSQNRYGKRYEEAITHLREGDEKHLVLVSSSVEASEAFSTG